MTPVALIVCFVLVVVLGACRPTTATAVPIAPTPAVAERAQPNGGGRVDEECSPAHGKASEGDPSRIALATSALAERVGVRRVAIDGLTGPERTRVGCALRGHGLVTEETRSSGVCLVFVKDSAAASDVRPCSMGTVITWVDDRAISDDGAFERAYVHVKTALPDGRYEHILASHDAAFDERATSLPGVTAALVRVGLWPSFHGLAIDRVLGDGAADVRVLGYVRGTDGDPRKDPAYQVSRDLVLVSHAWGTLRMEATDPRYFAWMSKHFRSQWGKGGIPFGPNRELGADHLVGQSMYAAVGTCNGSARGSRTIAVLRGRLRVVEGEASSATATLDVKGVEVILSPDEWTASFYPRYDRALRDVTAAVASGRPFDRATFAPIERAHDWMLGTYGEKNFSLFEVDSLLRQLRRDAERGDVDGAIRTLSRTRCSPLHAESDLKDALEASSTRR